MAPTASYMVLLLLVASAAVVRCRPQGASSRFDLGSSQPHGTFIGEIIVSSSHVDVKPRKKKTTTTPKPERVEEEVEEGPRVERLIGDPEVDLNLPNFGGASVAVASGPSLSISGPTITFKNPAQVVPIASE